MRIEIVLLAVAAALNTGPLSHSRAIPREVEVCGKVEPRPLARIHG